MTPFLESCLVSCFLGLGSGLFGAFAGFCLEEGNVFGFYFTRLRYYFYEKPVIGLEDFPKRKIYYKFLLFLYKPLGGCVYCLNFWLTLGLYFLLYYHTQKPAFYFLPFIEGFSFAACVWLTRKLDS